MSTGFDLSTVLFTAVDNSLWRPTMSTSQRLLSAHLLLLLGGLSAGCNDEGQVSGDTYCMDIEESEECPTVEEMNDTVFPTGPMCGGGSHMWAQEFTERREDPVWYWGDTGPGAVDYDSCCYDTAHRKTIRGQGCVVGRPVVEEEGTLALPSVRPVPSPWLSGPHPMTVSLNRGQRTALADHWLDAARTELASVASFNHLSLSLLALGAPPQLLMGAQSAANDELAHAQLCFTLASAYAGQPLSPGPLKIQVQPTTDLVQLAIESARDGAINETLAAIQAAAQLRSATDPAVRAALTRIIAEESAHAELAWATLRWCVDQGGQEVLDALAPIFENMRVPEPSAFPETSLGLSVPSHGLLDRDAVRAALAEGLVRVVRPAWEALAGS